MVIMTIESQPHRLSWLQLTHYFHLSLLGILAGVSSTEGVEGVSDYCSGEQFEASCEPDEVVVMRSALYGRMSLGRCVFTDYGHIGCHVDVLRHMDVFCSGRPSCETEVSAVETKLGTNPCGEFESYLEATYECYAAVTSSLGSCGPDGWVVITEPRGTLASIHANTDSTGTRLCPWVLHAPSGQRINITLYNFGLASTNSEESGPVICERIATINESPAQGITICAGGEERIKTVYLSEGNIVTIQIIPGELSTSGMFLFQYEFVGCPTINAPDNGWLDVEGDTAVIRCNQTGETWYLTCRNGQWIGEEYPTCDNAPDIKDSLNLDKFNAVHISGFVLGAIIGGIFVTLVAAFLIWKRRQRKTAGNRSSGNSESPKL